MSVEFAIINDIHNGPAGTGSFRGVQRKLVSESEKLVAEFVQLMNEVEQPEFVIDLGDKIEDVNDKEEDKKSFQKTLSLLSELKMPWYSLIGNHDIRTLSTTEVAEMLGYDELFYSFDWGLYHFIALSLEMTEDYCHDDGALVATLPAAQLEWLKNDLEQTDKNSLVFLHYGLAEDDLIGNFWFEGEPHFALLSNRVEVRQVLEESGLVKAVISAHQHWNRMNVHNGIPYFVLTSLIENFKNDGTPAKAYTMVSFDDTRIVVEVKGNDPVRFEYKFT